MANYQALILSVMCYNGECWPVSKNDLQHLEGTPFLHCD